MVNQAAAGMDADRNSGTASSSGKLLRRIVRRYHSLAFKTATSFNLVSLSALLQDIIGCIYPNHAKYQANKKAIAQMIAPTIYEILIGRYFDQK